VWPSAAVSLDDRFDQPAKFLLPQFGSLTRRLKLSSSKAAGSAATEAYPWGTSQGGARLRTKLEGSFSRR
jgi:hypothetical protein